MNCISRGPGLRDSCFGRGPGRVCRPAAGWPRWQVPHHDVQAVARACVEMLSGRDRRSQGAWLRQETLAAFGPSALVACLHQALAADRTA